MDIKDLTNGAKKVDVAGVITSIEEAREVNLRAGGSTTVANAKLKDASGEIKFVLWGADIDRVKEDSVITVTNGYVSEYQGTIQLNVGKYGKLTVDGS
jgi:replication factor A1